jgi:hypothetical protein
MEFAIVDLEHLSEEVDDLIYEMTDPYQEFDKVDVTLISDKPGVYGFLGIKLTKSDSPHTNPEFKTLEKVYFAYCAN